jgi:hypothetical protein
MKQPIRRILYTVLTVIFLLAACAPAPAPTADPVDVANQVATSVALTVAAQNLDTAEAAPIVTDTPLPTATLVLVDTPTPIPPTATPLVLASPTAISGGGGGVSLPRPELSCDTIRRRPFDNTIFQPNERFDIKWTIINNGTKTIRAGRDLKYSNGDKLMPDVIVELPELEPGEQFEVNFDAVAPAREGTYVMVYVVEGPLCYPYTSIKVER